MALTPADGSGADGTGTVVLRIVLSSIVFLVLTLLTQIGGVLWLLSLVFRQKMLAFIALYAASLVVVPQVAPLLGRVQISCLEKSSLEFASPMYCLLHRNYVTPELKDVLTDTSQKTADAFPNTVTVVLDANFPFWDGFPLLPHLSHNDGEKVDLAYFYADEKGKFLNRSTKSPIGYFAFEQGHTHCEPQWPTLRWDMEGIQSYFPTWPLEPRRNRFLIQTLMNDQRVSKIFVEPHLLEKLDLSHPKLRFQGCRAARHDDHIHFQL
ncbi:hypothetical protein [Cognatishimia sp.]|uniref:hypothetical protein n=1 Tax=Cognatishimia sp. TaxID=2211648 RepID=UPI003514EACB